MMITAGMLIEEARTWIGVPYLHQGRSRFGVDCAGLMVAIMRSLGALPAEFRDPCNYARRPDGQMLALVSQHFTRTRDESAGVLVLIRWPRDQEPSHAALLTGQSMIHAFQRHGAVVEHSFRGPWRRDMHSLWRFPGVAYV